MSDVVGLDLHISLLVLATAVAGLVYAIYLTFEIRKYSQGTEQMQKISGSIRQRADTYLKRQMRSVAFIVVFLVIALYISGSSLDEPGVPSLAWGRALAFLMGAIFSGAVGYFGMTMAVKGNVRVAQAARTDFGEALKIGYRTGTITGMLTDGLGLLGGTLVFILYGSYAYEVLLGFGFGGALIALFMRVGGGIYTKAADVGADLVGKIEKGIPEDDPRNPAVIADLVGDNVGDCAGMAADIFESYEVTMVSAMILGLSTFGFKGVIFPLMVRAIGVVSSIIGTYNVKLKGEKENALRAINRGFALSAVISIVGFFLLAQIYMKTLNVAVATFAGVILAVSINLITEYFTSAEHEPVKGITRSTRTGSATTILRGIAVGYEGTVWAILLIVVAIFGSVVIFELIPLESSMFGSDGHFALPEGISFADAKLTAPFYGVALCGIGMLTLTGNNISMDAFGPIADNAQGIAEMADLEPEAKRILAELDSVGNTTKAITKGVAIGSAVIAAVSLFAAYVEEVEKALGVGVKLALEISDPYVFIGLLIGGAIPFLFSSFAIRAVERGASNIVIEVRRQFNEIDGLMEGTAEPDYASCVDICVRTAQKELIGLGVLAMVSPILVGFLLDERSLGGFLAGVIVVGQLLAVFMTTSGGAWDNAKKRIEEGLYGGKGSEAHVAGVVGDTVGDPLKDTAGPALNPMVKVINLISVIAAPLVVKYRNTPPMLGGINLIPIMMVGLIILLGFTIWQSKKELPLGTSFEE